MPVSCWRYIGSYKPSRKIWRRGELRGRAGERGVGDGREGLVRTSCCRSSSVKETSARRMLWPTACGRAAGGVGQRTSERKSCRSSTRRTFALARSPLPSTTHSGSACLSESLRSTYVHPAFALESGELTQLVPSVRRPPAAAPLSPRRHRAGLKASCWLQGTRLRSRGGSAGSDPNSGCTASPSVVHLSPTPFSLNSASLELLPPAPTTAWINSTQLPASFPRFTFDPTSAAGTRKRKS